MDWKTLDSIKNYNKIASNYDTSFDGKFTKRLKDEIAEVILLEDNYRVLDVACGNGKLLDLINKKKRINAYGIDVSDNMISEAGKNYPEMKFKVADSSSLPYEDLSFNAVTVCAAFHHFTEPDKFLTEVMRVLKKGGSLYIADPYFPPVILQLCNILFPLLKMGDVKIYSKKELMNFLQNHGFREVNIYRFQKYGNMAIGKK